MRTSWKIDPANSASTNRCLAFRRSKRWLADLRDRKGRAIIEGRLDRLEQGNFGLCKAIGNGVLELKIDFGPGYRVYFAEDGQNVVLLLIGGDKASQAKDIQLAQNYWQDYKERRNE